MAMTYRQAINAVLTTLGSALIPATNTTVTDSYQLQVCEFFNQILDEVAVATQWRARRITYNVAVPSGTNSAPLIGQIIGTAYTLGAAGTTGTVTINGTTTAAITTGGTNAGVDAQAVVDAINAISGTTGVAATLYSSNISAPTSQTFYQIGLSAASAAQANSTVTVAYNGGSNVSGAVTGLAAGSYTLNAPNSNCSVVRMMNPQVGYPVALCFDTTSYAGTPFPLKEIPMPDLQYMNTITTSTPISYSTHFAVQDTGDDNVTLLLYPIGSVARNIQITLHNPLPRFNPALAGTSQAASGAALDAPLVLPYRPLVLGTVWSALEERGEELGASSQFTEEKWRQALDDAVSRDADEAGGLIMLAD